MNLTQESALAVIFGVPSIFMAVLTFWVTYQMWVDSRSNPYDLEKSSIVSDSLACQDDRPVMSSRVLSNDSSIELQIPARVHTNDSGHYPEQLFIADREEAQCGERTTVSGNIDIGHG